MRNFKPDSQGNFKLTNGNIDSNHYQKFKVKQGGSFLNLKP